MAKQKNSKEITKEITQLELIQTLLNDAYLQKDDKFLQEEVSIKPEVLEGGKPKKRIMQWEIVVSQHLNYILYKFDEDKKLLPFFADTSGLKQVCDYFLFVEEKKSLHVLLIELKEGTESAQKQLVAANYFIDFIVQSAERVGIKLTENIFIKKIRISEERTEKAKEKKRLTNGRIPLNYDINSIINYDYANAFRVDAVLDVV